MTEEEFLKCQEGLRALCPEVKNVTFALTQYFGVKFFRYVRSYSTGDKYMICTHEEWLDAYFKEKFYNTELANYHKHPEGSTGISIHGKCMDDHPVHDFWNRQGSIINYNNILGFYVKFHDYFELYDFGFNEEDNRANQIFLNNLKLFRHFFLYFKSRGNNILKKAEDYKFPSPVSEDYNTDENWMLGITDQLAKIARQEMPILEIYLDDEFANICLTLDESKSLKVFLEGYKFTEIPVVMGISEARYKDHLAKVMKKLNVDNYLELRKLCHTKHVASKLKFLNMDDI